MNYEIDFHPVILLDNGLFFVIYEELFGVYFEYSDADVAELVFREEGDVYDESL